MLRLVFSTHWDQPESPESCACFPRRWGKNSVYVMYPSQSYIIYFYLSNMHWMQTTFRLKSAVERFTWFTVAAMPRKHDGIQIFKAKNGPQQQVSIQKLYWILTFKATYCTNSCSLLKCTVSKLMISVKLGGKHVAKLTM